MENEVSATAMPNKEQILSFVRQALIYGGGVMTGRGMIDAATANIAIGIIMWLLVGGWGLWERRRAGLIKMAAAQPGVVEIRTDAKTAAELKPANIVPA